MSPPKKKTTKRSNSRETIDDVDTNGLFPVAPASSVTSKKAVHVDADHLVTTLNDAVSGIYAVFQLRDNLEHQIRDLKHELEMGQNIKLENDRLEAIKREQEQFLYEFQVKKDRLERELEETRLDSTKALKAEELAHRNTLKEESDAQTLKLKVERDAETRTRKLAEEDLQRKYTALEEQKALLEKEREAIEAERAQLREKLVQELNRENAHALQVEKLNHARELELLRGELKLEQASREKFEHLLAESQKLNEKLSEQLATLSREALASASSSSMESRLKEIVSRINNGGSSARTSS